MYIYTYTFFTFTPRLLCPAHRLTHNFSYPKILNLPSYLAPLRRRLQARARFLQRSTYTYIGLCPAVLTSKTPSSSAQLNRALPKRGFYVYFYVYIGPTSLLRFRRRKRVRNVKGWTYWACPDRGWPRFVCGQGRCSASENGRK